MTNLHQVLGWIDNTNKTNGYGCELQGKTRENTQTMSRSLVDSWFFILPVNLRPEQCRTVYAESINFYWCEKKASTELITQVFFRLRQLSLISYLLISTFETTY